LDPDEDIVDFADVEYKPFLAWEGLLAGLADVSVVSVKMVFVKGGA